MAVPLIEAQNVAKSYGKFPALHPLNLTITDDENIWAIIGPNGAGKTTLIKLMLNLIPATQGTIVIDGFDHTSPQSRSRLTYLPEKFSFYPYYTVSQTLSFFAGLRHLHNKEEKKQTIQKAIDQLGLHELEKRKITTLSKGQLQRVGLAQLLVHPSSTKLLILDEPFSGLDPIGIRDLKQLLRNLATHGKTLLISSHLLSEMEQIAEKVLILNKGHLLKQISIKEVQKKGSLENYFCSLVEGDSSNV